MTILVLIEDDQVFVSAARRCMKAHITNRFTQRGDATRTSINGMPTTTTCCIVTVVLYMVLRFDFGLVVAVVVEW